MLRMLRYGGHHGPQPGFGYYTLMSYREELTTLMVLLGAATGQVGTLSSQTGVRSACAAREMHQELRAGRKLFPLTTSCDSRGI